MSREAFQRGFAEGFLSPFTFFLTPAKKQRPELPSVPYQAPKLPDVSAAAAWAQTNERFSQAIQKILSPFPQHLAHYRRHYPDREARLAALDEKLSKILKELEALERHGSAEAVMGEQEEGERTCRGQTKMTQTAQKKV